MKRTLIVMAILFAVISTSMAQDGERIFKKFKGEVSMGYGYFPGSAFKSGLLWTLEPKFAVLDQLTIGGKFESAFQYKEFGNTDYGSYSSNSETLKIYQSFSVTADYFFSNNYSLRPFAGVGGGVHVANITNTGYDYNTSDGTSTQFALGGLVRAGVEIQHFRFGIEYNFVADTKSPYDVYNGSYYTVYDISKNSYFAVKAGVCFGGGPKDKGRRNKAD